MQYRIKYLYHNWHCHFLWMSVTCLSGCQFRVKTPWICCQCCGGARLGPDAGNGCGRVRGIKWDPRAAPPRSSPLSVLFSAPFTIASFFFFFSWEVATYYGVPLHCLRWCSLIWPSAQFLIGGWMLLACSSREKVWRRSCHQAANTTEHLAPEQGHFAKFLVGGLNVGTNMECTDDQNSSWWNHIILTQGLNNWGGGGGMGL